MCIGAQGTHSEGGLQCDESDFHVGSSSACTHQPSKSICGSRPRTLLLVWQVETRDGAMIVTSNNTEIDFEYYDTPHKKFKKMKKFYVSGMVQVRT